MRLAENIGPAGRRRRYVTGGVALAAGLALAGGLIAGGAPLGARFVVFVPFVFGALGLFQAQGHT
jgi:hypothetical protein